MYQSHKMLLGFSALLFSFNTVANTDSDEQQSTHEQLYAQVQQLQFDMLVANKKIAALENKNKVAQHAHENFFKTSSTSHGRNR